MHLEDIFIMKFLVYAIVVNLKTVNLKNILRNIDTKMTFYEIFVCF